MKTGGALLQALAIMVLAGCVGSIGGQPFISTGVVGTPIERASSASRAVKTAQCILPDLNGKIVKTELEWGFWNENQREIAMGMISQVFRKVGAIVVHHAEKTSDYYNFIYRAHLNLNSGWMYATYVPAYIAVSGSTLRDRWGHVWGGGYARTIVMPWNFMGGAPVGFYFNSRLIGQDVRIDMDSAASLPAEALLGLC